MLNRRSLLFCLILLPTTLPAADKPRDDTGKLAEMRRYLRGLQFGNTFQGGIRKVNATRDGQSTPFLDRLLAASPEELEATVAPAFARHVTLSEARAMADFITSELGQRMIHQGRDRPGDPQRPVNLSSEELDAVVKFDRTPAGKKTVQLTSDPQIRQEYFALLQARYEK